MYSVYQHWDPLRVCAVGKSYPPEFYSFIKNTKARSVMEQIAQETEEDYQKLIKLLESFGVEIVRPDISDDFDRYLFKGRYYAPPMCPRDGTAMIGEKFYFGGITAPKLAWEQFLDPKVTDAFRLIPELSKEDLVMDPCPLPFTASDYEKLPQLVKEFGIVLGAVPSKDFWKPMIDKVKAQQNEIIFGAGINSATLTRVGKDLYHGMWDYEHPGIVEKRQSIREGLFPEYRNHIVNSFGHTDGNFCPVVPGLLFSIIDDIDYGSGFPDWEVVYLSGESWDKVRPFLNLKQKNKGKWWVPGEEYNDDFTDFVENWLNHWVGYVEESVFDVNILVIDQKNVICNGYNKLVFDALERHGVTPHVINFRHRYFWDGGLHCITSDLDRDGTMQDYFPERG